MAAFGVFYEFQRHTGVAAVVFFINIKVPGLAAFLAGLAGHITALSHTVPFIEYRQAAFKVVFNIHLAQLGGHLPVDIQNLFTTGLGRFQNIGHRLFPVVEVVEIFVEHRAPIPQQFFGEVAHIAVLVGVIVLDQIVQNLFAVYGDAFEVGQVVEPVHLSGNVRRVHPVQQGKGAEHAGWRVANAVGKIVAHIPQSLGHDPGRICKVEYLYARIFFNQLAVSSQRRYAAHGKGQPGSAGGFLPQYPVIQGNALVFGTHFVLPHPNGGDYIVRVPYRFHRVGREGKAHFRAQQARYMRRHTAVDAQLFLVIVHKTQFVDPQPLCLLGNAFCQEHGAHTASAKYRDLHRTPPVFPRARAKIPIL